MHFKEKSLKEYWRENHQKLDAFICQYEKNFQIDGYTTDETHVAYASSFIAVPLRPNGMSTQIARSTKSLILLLGSI